MVHYKSRCLNTDCCLLSCLNYWAANQLQIQFQPMSWHFLKGEVHVSFMSISMKMAGKLKDSLTGLWQLLQQS